MAQVNSPWDGDDQADGSSAFERIRRLGRVAVKLLDLTESGSVRWARQPFFRGEGGSIEDDSFYTAEQGHLEFRLVSGARGPVLYVTADGAQDRLSTSVAVRMLWDKVSQGGSNRDRTNLQRSLEDFVETNH